MTTNVPKGAGRGAALAKKSKHAQRTPLPPRPDAVAEARTAVAEATAPSVVKATDFAGAAKALGWETAVWWEGDHSKVLAERGSEGIQIEWVGGVFQPESCNYRRGDGNAVRLRNAAAAKARMAVTAEEAEKEASRVRKFRTERAPGTPRPASAPRRALPEGWETMLDGDVLSAVQGRKIAWVNRVSGLEEEDFVRVVESVRVKQTFSTTTTVETKAALPSLAAPKIHEGPSGRVLHFLGAFGFRCVLVSQIVRVRR